MITDVGLPGGPQRAPDRHCARVLRPKLQILFITGYAGKRRGHELFGGRNVRADEAVQHGRAGEQGARDAVSNRISGDRGARSRPAETAEASAQAARKSAPAWQIALSSAHGIRASLGFIAVPAIEGSPTAVQPALRLSVNGAGMARKFFSRCGITSHRRCSAFWTGTVRWLYRYGRVVMHKILPELVTQHDRFLLGYVKQLCGSSRLRSDQSRFGYTKGLRQLLTRSSF